MLANANNFHKIVVIFLACCGLNAQAHDFAGGTGDPNDPYQIATAAQLVSIGSDPNLLDKHFVLVNDIDLDPNLPGGRTLTQAVVAPDTNDAAGFQGIAFTGDFDGNNHTIRNLVVRGYNAHYLGLFGSVGRQAVVKDLGVENANIGGSYVQNVGTLAASNYGRIVRCYAEGTADGWETIGGLVGDNAGDILYCYVSGRITAHTRAGGLVAYNGANGRIVNCHATCMVLIAFKGSLGGGLVGHNWGYITNCYASGGVLGGDQSFELGGLVGVSLRGTITNCYAAGDISAGKISWNLGGLIGRIGLQEDGEICNCYATGAVSAGDNSGALGGLVGYSWGRIARNYAIGRVSGGQNSKEIGGLVGEKFGGAIEMSFWNTEASGLSASAGGTGLSTAQMQEMNTFTVAGWDFVGERANGTADIWLMPPNGGYPTLALLYESYDPPKLAGSGTAEDPYQIATPEDLGAIWHHDPSACFELTGDVDLSGITWGTAPIPEVHGRFDGAGFVISNLMIDKRDQLNLFGSGLFGSVGPGATVNSLGMRDANIACGEGLLYGLGTLAGRNWGRIAACYAIGHISTGMGTTLVGGLIGRNGGSVSNSYAAVDVSAGLSNYRVGGLVGDNLGSIADSYARGAVSRQDRTMYANGLLGANLSGAVTNSYFLAPSDGGAPGNEAGLPLTDEQMKQRASFADWDFANTWMICEGRDYPHLQWEEIDCAQP